MNIETLPDLLETDLPPQALKVGNTLTRWLGRRLLTLLGWKFKGVFPTYSKVIFIVAPHRSNWDWVVGVACKMACGFHVNYLVKHTLFFWPLGWLMSVTGGIPVNRKEPGNLADTTAAAFSQRPHFWLAMTPEGTRSKVERWKTGFLRIAYQSDIPVIPVILLNSKRCVVMESPLSLQGDLHRDIEQVMAYYEKRLSELET